MNAKAKGTYLIILMATIVLAFSVFGICTSMNEKAHAEGTETYTSTPVITILLHGMGGSPLDWNNNGEFGIVDYHLSGGHFIAQGFTYRKDSLIERIRQKHGNAEVYIVSEKEDSFDDTEISETITLGDVAIDKFSIGNTTDNSPYVRTEVTGFDFSKHCIIVYNSSNSDDLDEGIDILYSRYRKVLKAITTAYKNANMNIAPRMNLIGHSRGTILNLKYATEFTDQIDGMFALGGLFNGSVLAEIALNYSTLKSLLGDEFPELDSQFIEEITTESVTEQLKTEWNTAIVGKDIHAYAVSSSFDVEFIKKFIQDSTHLEWTPEKRKKTNNIITILQKVGKAILGFSDFARSIVDFYDTIFDLNLPSAQKNILSDDFEQVLQYLTNYKALPFDGMVDTKSQSAQGYNNVCRLYRRYSTEADLSHISQGNLEFPHNLETQDLATINFIMRNINLGRYDLFDYTDIGDNDIVVNGINRRYNGAISSDIVIPTTIDGKTVIGIAPYAFCEDGSGNSITSMTFPQTLGTIGEGAFLGCESLSTLNNTIVPAIFIHNYAFMGCGSLNDFNLPTSLYEIGAYAFSDCKSLTQFNIHDIVTLGIGAFSGCDHITSFSKYSYNFTFDIPTDGSAIFNSSGTELIAYAGGRTASSYTIPTTVTTISEGAFGGAIHLQDVILPNGLQTIGHRAFKNSALRSVTVYGNCTEIGAYAFNCCDDLETVYLYPNGNMEIGEGAFNGIADDCSFYVPYSAINGYKAKIEISQYNDVIYPISFIINYVTYNGETIPETVVYYGSVPTIYNSQSLIKTGYAIDGWYQETTGENGTGAVFDGTSIYNKKGDTTLYAKWVKQSNGNVKFYSNSTNAYGVMQNASVEYDDSYTIPSCGYTYMGYDFSGWATSSTGNVSFNTGDVIEHFRYDTLNLYAVWIPTHYIITYQLNGATGGISNLPPYYTVENNVILPTNITRPGNEFYGWVLVGDTDGFVITETNGYKQNLTVRAEWVVKNINIATYTGEITNTAVELDFSTYANGADLGGREIKISKTVDSITLKDMSNLKNVYFNIDNSRQYPINLILDSASFTAPYNKQGIIAFSADINIFVKRESYIRGGTSILNNGDITQIFLMATGITANKLGIYKYPTTNGVPRLFVYGGRGKDGANGQNGSAVGNNQAGQNGTNGENGYYGSLGIYVKQITVGANVELYAYGGDGGNGGNGGNGSSGGNTTTTVGKGVVGITGTQGGNGGNGGKGGNGNYALFTLMQANFASAQRVHLIPGYGGSGGNGGSGGKGGKGGTGGDGTFGKPAARGGTGGAGGNGGNGGAKGSAGGTIISFYDADFSAGPYYDGQAGYGGAGGAGGAGGRGGKKWLTNNYAATGSTGASGSPGANGSSVS